MKRLTLASCVLASMGVASAANAQIPGLIDRPSPPPCAADGTCYPNTDAWGYYPGRWRTWPGVALEPTPSTISPTPADLGPELAPHETPPPELEDKQAPPATTKRQPSPLGAEPTENGGDAEPVPPQIPQTPPTGLPTSDADPPPAFPLSLLSGGQPAAPPAITKQVPANTAHRTANDPPPAPPWGQQASL
jgi:hypothetical protein